MLLFFPPHPLPFLSLWHRGAQQLSCAKRRRRRVTSELLTMDNVSCDSFQFVDVTEVTEIYYCMLAKMYDRTAATKNKLDDVLDGRLTDSDSKAKEQFVEKNNVSQLSQDLIEYLVLLQRHLDGKPPPVPHTAIYTALLRVEKALRSKTSWLLVENGTGSCGDGGASPVGKETVTVSDFELNILEQTNSQFVSRVLGEGTTETLFFPLTKNPSPKVVVTWRVLEKIAQVKLIPDTTLYMHKLRELAKMKVKKEVYDWLEPLLSHVAFQQKEDVSDEAKTLIKALQELNDELSRASEARFLVDSLFASLRCSYWELISNAVEEKLLPLCKRAIEKLDEYQKAYRDFHVNLRESCVLSHALYLRMKHAFSRILPAERKADDRNHDIETMFGNSFLNLLHAIDVECHRRVIRAVETETKDSVIEEKSIMSSTVIVLNCICTVVDEWSKLEIEADDMKMAFLIKVTDVICDSAKAFAGEMESRALRMNIHAKDSGCAKKICYLINSVEHVREFVSTIPDMMHWEELLKDGVQEPSVADYRSQVRRVLKLLLESMHSHMDSIVEATISVLVTRIHVQYSRYLNSLLQNTEIHLPGTQNTEKFLAHLHEKLGEINDVMKENVFPRFLRSLWISFLKFTRENFKEGASPEQAKTIRKNIVDMNNYFSTLEVERGHDDSQLLQLVLNTLAMNSKSTVELQLQYFSYFADSVVPADELLGEIAVQAGFKKMGRGTIEIHFKIKKFQKLPVRKFDIGELCVKLELCPKVLFPSSRPLKTKPIPVSQENPAFEESFRFSSLPVSLLSLEGSVIQATVRNQDWSFRCEALLKLSRIRDMTGLSSVEFLPVYLLALRRMDETHDVFRVLELRRKRDRQAKRFVSRRKQQLARQSQLLACVGVRKPLRHFHLRHFGRIRIGQR